MIVLKQKPPAVYRLFAICPGGLDEILKQEIEGLGAKILDVYPGGVEFEGNLEMAYTACLSLRTASRVLLLLKSAKKIFKPEEFYDEVRSIDWTHVFYPTSTFAVYLTETQTKERRIPVNPQFWALKAKDAIVDQFREKKNERPNVDRKEPDITIRFHLHDQMLKTYLDLSGPSLHERGYRSETLEAPMKETLAAGLLFLAGWDKLAREKVTFYDPFCGSGTLLIEAAMMATHTAPGLYRTHFGFYAWKDHQHSVFEAVSERLKEKRILDPEQLPEILGSDADAAALRVALKNCQNAHFDQLIQLRQARFEETEAPRAKGLMVTNPPYGVRIGETEALVSLYQSIGSTLKHRYKGWTCAIITSDKKLMHGISLKPSKKAALYNGGLESTFSVFNLY
jgi:23S rRNA (guanine2445-N2)-methyltransferase / 23S rRNA (guanine2069-N7)-methyltransferase